MVVLEGKSKDHQRPLDSSSGDHEYLYRISLQLIQYLLIFQSVPKWWTNRLQSQEITRVIWIYQLGTMHCILTHAVDVEIF